MRVKSARRPKKNLSARSKKSFSATSKSIKYAVILLIFFTSLISLAAVFAYKTFTQKYSLAYSPDSYNISDQDIFTVMFVSVDNFSSELITAQQISMLIFDKNTKKVIVYTISPYLSIDVPGKFDTENFSKILALGSMNDESGGVDLMKKTLTKTFGFKVDKYILADKKLREDFNNFLETSDFELSISIENFEKFRESLKTDMTFRELYDVYSFINSLPSDRVVIKEISEKDLSATDNLDEEIREVTLESKISLERKTVAVLNGSEVPGAAAFGARAVENLGGRVVASGNASQTYEKSMLIVDDLTSETVKNIKQVFDIEEVLVKGTAFSIYESEISRVDVTLILGVDSADIL